MPKTARYALLAAPSSTELEPLVNKRIASRWQLYGCPFEQGAMVCQAMILSAADEKRIRKTSDD